MTIVVAGHVCVDITPQLSGSSTPGLDPGMLYAVGPLTQRLGGCVANTGAALTRLGVPVRAFATVGRDDLAVSCRSLLAHRIGPDVRLRDCRLGTSYSIVIEHPGHDRTFWQHEGACAEFDPTDVELASDVTALHIGYPSLLPRLCTAPTDLRRLLADARNRGVTTSLDLAHVAPGSVASRVDWAEWFALTAPQVDVWSPSWDDITSALRLTGEPTREGLQNMAERMIGWGCAVVALSAGPLGFVLCGGSRRRLEQGGALLQPVAASWAEARRWFPAEPIAQPHTTVGAGDSLTAALLAALRQGLGPTEAGNYVLTYVRQHLRGEYMPRSGE